MSDIKPFFDHQGGFVALDLPASLYPLETIHGAAFIFLDRAYIRLEEGPKKAVRVLLKPQEGEAKADLEHLAGLFLNELINQSIRTEVSKANNKLREYIVAKALYSADENQDDFMDLLGEDEDDVIDDPLGIATPWEEKYAKEAPAAPAPEASHGG